MSTSLSRALRLAIRLIACGGLCASSAAEAQIYGSVASDGSVVLSNFRNEQARDIVVVDDAARRTVMPYAVMPDTRFSALIHKAATGRRRRAFGRSSPACLRTQSSITAPSPPARNSVTTSSKARTSASG